MQSQSTDLLRNYVLRKNNYLISDIFKLKTGLLALFAFQRDVFWSLCRPFRRQITDLVLNVRLYTP